MKIAAQLYTVRDFTKTEADIYETLKKVKAIGYGAVQLSALGPCEPENLKKMLDELSLTACATHTPFDRIVSDTDAVIAEHKLLGIKYVGLGWYGLNGIGDCEIFLDKIAPATEKLSAAGLKFLYHNHAHEFIRYGGVRPLDYLRDRTDAGKFGFLPDFYWIQYAGVSPVKFMEEYAGRADVVHLKDMRAAPEGQNRMAEIYEGNMDYGAIVGACKKAGVLWAAVEQDVCDRDPFESLKISFDNIVRSGQIAG